MQKRKNTLSLTLHSSFLKRKTAYRFTLIELLVVTARFSGDVLKSIKV